jgi:hypothetical protein
VTAHVTLLVDKVRACYGGHPGARWFPSVGLVIGQRCSGNWQRREYSQRLHHADNCSFSSQSSQRSLRCSAKMNYGKKDEDADTGLVKIDRTQVFQEGEQGAQEHFQGAAAAKLAGRTQLDSSTAPRSNREDAAFS